MAVASPTRTSDRTTSNAHRKQLITTKPINRPSFGRSVFGREDDCDCCHLSVSLCASAVRFHGDRPQSFCDPFRVDVVSRTEAAAVTTATRRRHQRPTLLFAGDDAGLSLHSGPSRMRLPESSPRKLLEMFFLGHVILGAHFLSHNI